MFSEIVNNDVITTMDDKVELFGVEEGPLEETLDSPRFYNLTVEETRDEAGLVTDHADRSRIVFSPGD